MKAPKSLFKLLITKAFVFSLFIIPLTHCSISDDDLTTDTDDSSEICTNINQAVFLEQDALVMVEIEDVDYNGTPWQLEKALDAYSGEGYLVWQGENAFNNPGIGLLRYTIRISNPGTYRFLWRSYITEGTSHTESNDSWLRIADAKHFYGIKNNGSVVYPNGTLQDPIPESAGQTNTSPEGSSKDGWFKIYMNKGGQWHWDAKTSDNDGHIIFAVFDEAGDYTIEISGRSKGHGIDKFLLFQEQWSQQEATESTLSVKTCN